MDFIHNFLKRQFYFLGSVIGKQPKAFVIVSIVISLVCASGIYTLNFNTDTDYLFTIENSKTKIDRVLLEKYFPSGLLPFDPSRTTRLGRFLKLIITPANKTLLWNSENWEEILLLDKFIHNISFNEDETIYDYSKLCAKVEDDCYENKILKYRPEFLMEKVFEINKLRNSSRISFEAVILKYFLDLKSYEDNQRAKTWEKSVIKKLSLEEKNWKNIFVSRLTANTLSEEPEINTLAVFPYISVTIVLIIAFVMIACMSRDWVTSKACVGLMGIISSILGACGACGVLGFVGVDFIGINLALPFITLGIGLDDTFVMLSAWRKTSVNVSVSKRLADCYSECAISITITTITDILSFYVGVFSPIPSIKIFSIYAGTSIFFIYIMHIFFFGSALAISGYSEEKLRNLSLRQLETKSQDKVSEEKSMSIPIVLLWESFTSGTIFAKKENTYISRMSINKVFEDYWASFINKIYVQISAIILYTLYISASVYGLTQLKTGLLRENLVRYDSYMHDYFVKEHEYFSKYSHRIQVMITSGAGNSPLEYYSNSTHTKISALLQQCTSLSHITSEFNENWIHDFNLHIESNNMNVTSNADFILALKNVSKILPRISLDLSFNEDQTEIIASRFIIQSHDIQDVNDEISLYTNLQRIAEENQDFKVTIFHPYFDFIELHIITTELAIKLVGLAAAIVMFVSFLVIPSISGSLCTSLSVLSIELGVLGFMSFWGIRLDLISVICLIMCIGFSVDFSAHVSYAYINCGNNNNISSDNDRLRHTLGSLGKPVIQGAVSTLIGVSALALVPSYIFQCFFKIVFLVMIHSVFHALFILPIILSAPKLVLRQIKGGRVYT